LSHVGHITYIEIIIIENRPDHAQALLYIPPHRIDKQRPRMSPDIHSRDDQTEQTRALGRKRRLAASLMA